MGNMKANKKFIEGEDAVSAVIGVILMVAITVAIAATVYVYVSGMIGTSPESTPTIQFTKDTSAKTLTVATADPNDIDWSDIEVSSTGTVLTCSGWTATEPIKAGHMLKSCSGTITIRHIATNTLIGTWTF